MAFLLKSLANKGVKIVEFPGFYDLQSIIPFLLINDHSILVVKNPRKDVLPILKDIIRNGVIFYKQENGQRKPIKVNITVWVFFDVFPWLQKINKTKPNQERKKVRDMCHQEFGDNGELLSLFDIVLDISQFSNLEIMG
jgi:hypothetical protein